MANVNTIKTRILNKYDLLANYTSSFVPLKGEICLVEIPSSTSGSGLTPPAVGIKVGDGTTTFNNLQWVQAIAGDVSSFVKTISSQSVFAAEVGKAIGYTGQQNVKNLIDAINTKFDNYSTTAQMNTELGKKVDTTTLTAYQSQVTELLAGKVSNSEFATYQGEVTAALNKKVETSVADSNASSTNKLTSASTVDSKVKASSDAINTTIGQLTSLTTTTKTSVVASINEIKGRVDDNAEAIEELQAAVGTGADGLATKVSTLEGEMDEVQGALAGYTSSSTVASAVEAAEKAGTDAQKQVGTLSSLKTNVKTSAVAAINEVHDELDATTGSLTALSNKVTALVGSDTAEGTTIRSIAANEVSKIVNGADTSYDTLKEISDWILNDTTGAADMANDIAELQALHAKKTADSYKTVAEEVAQGISAANLDQYATDSDLDAYKTEVSETYATKAEVASTITAASSAVQSASFAGKAMTKSGTALSISQADARTALGLGSMAYTATTSYLTKTETNAAINTAKTDVQGSSGDASSAATIAGAKKYADEKVAALNSELSEDIKANTDAIAAMDASIATGNGIIDTITQTNGKITASTRRQIKNADLDTTDVFVFYCGNATGYDAAMNTVTI